MRAVQGDERGHLGFLKQTQILDLKLTCHKMSWAYLHSPWSQVLILWVSNYPMKEKRAHSI